MIGSATVPITYQEFQKLFDQPNPVLYYSGLTMDWFTTLKRNPAATEQTFDTMRVRILNQDYRHYFGEVVDLESEKLTTIITTQKNMEIRNPYDEGNVDTLSMYFPINKNAFDEGVQAALNAMKPKKFSEECPEEGQKILVLSSEFRTETEAMNFNPNKFDGKYYHWLDATYTHWMPYPDLD
jgi:hypothetical protein